MSVALEPYVFDTLMPDLVGHDRQPSAFPVYLMLARHTHGVERQRVTMAQQDIAESCGLSKRTVQAAPAHLRRRTLIAVMQAHRTSVPEYAVLRPWRRG